ncbi:tetratricopeptide repeat protein [Bradyrhizobium sp. ISRA435]|nr:tetratricopeptide repeat protein [Bradyrhizobium sp. ISRA435]
MLTVIPQHQEATARLGRLAWEDGDLTAAVNLLERATANDAPASVWFDLGVARQDLRDHDGAARAYSKALELKPDYAEAALNLGIALQDGGAPDAAIGAFARAYGLRPAIVRIDRDGADLGLAWPPVARRGRAARGAGA